MYIVSTTAGFAYKVVKKGNEFNLKKELDRVPTQPSLMPRVGPLLADIPRLPSQNQVINTVYSLDGSLVERVPMPTKILEIITTLNHKGFVWRKVSHELLQKMQKRKGFRILMDGPAGVGKSVLLLQLFEILQQTRQANQVVLYCPRISRWTSGHYSYEPMASDSQVYAQADLARDILKWNSLLDPNSNHNTNVGAIDRLKGYLESITEQDVIIVADEINALFAPTGYRSLTSKLLDIGNLLVPQMIRDFISRPNTSLVGAYCRSAPSLVDSTLDSADLHAESYQIPYFSASETLVVLEYYRSLGHLIHPTTMKYAGKIHFVSGGCPAKILPAIDYESVYKRK